MPTIVDRNQIVSQHYLRVTQINNPCLSNTDSSPFSSTLIEDQRSYQQNKALRAEYPFPSPSTTSSINVGIACWHCHAPPILSFYIGTRSPERILLLAFQFVVNAPNILTLSAVARVDPAFTPSRQTSSILLSVGCRNVEQGFVVSQVDLSLP